MPVSFVKWLAAVGLFALLWPTALAAQDEQAWRDKMSSAMNAHQMRAYGAAEDRLAVALKIAEGFGPRDPRLAETLLALSTVYFEQDRYAEAQGPLERAVEILEPDGGRLLGPTLIALAERAHPPGRLRHGRRHLPPRARHRGGDSWSGAQSRRRRPGEPGGFARGRRQLR